MASWDAKSEKLFVEHAIPEIREIEKKTKQDIENKKEELRQMVGEQYRDLIDAADTIVTMSASSSEVMGSINKMQELCTTLQHGGARWNQSAAVSMMPGTAGDKQAHSKLHMVATRMKQMMDAPEQVWSALEQQQYCDAAVVYLMVDATYAQLRGATDTETLRLLKSFPILGRQWTSISGFKDSILKKVTAALATQHKEATVVEALAAKILLDGSSCQDACNAFLAARAKAVPAALNQELSSVTVEQQVCEATSLLVVTLQQLYTILYTNPLLEVMDPEEGAAPVTGSLYRYLSEITTRKSGESDSATATTTSTSSPSSSSSPPSSSSSSTSSSSGYVPVPVGSTIPMTQAELKTACSTWLDSVVEETARNCGKALRHVQTISGLTTIRDAVYTMLERKCADLAEILPEIAAASIGLDDGARTSVDRLALLVGGVSFDPWARILQPVFVQRAQAILSGMFRLATQDLAPEIRKASDLIAASNGTSDDCDLSNTLWTSSTFDASDLVRYKGLQGWESLPFVKELSLHTGGYTSNVVLVVDAVTEKLGGIMADAQKLLAPGDGDNSLGGNKNTAGGAAGGIAGGSGRAFLALSPSRGGGGGMTSSSSLSFLSRRGEAETPAPFDKYSDAIEMRRFLQAACEQFVQDFVKWVALERQELQRQMEEVGTVHRLLYLGRLCKAIAERCSPIEKLIMLPAASDRPKRGRAAKTFRTATARSRQQLTEHERRLKDSKARLGAECSACQMQWVAVVTKAHGTAFSRRVLQEDWLQMFAAKRVWQHHSIDEESEAGKQIKSTVLLPSQPSSFISNFLCGVSTEVNQAGGHTIGRDVLVRLARNLFAEIAGAYSAMLKDDNVEEKVGQSGYVQILFDVSFLTDILVGPETGPQVDTASTALAKELIDKIRAAIDPFDLDVFTPLLQSSRTKAYHRSAVLMGFFASLNPAHQGARPMLSSSETHNTVALADVVPRFPLLPLGSATLRTNSNAAYRANEQSTRSMTEIFAI